MKYQADKDGRSEYVVATDLTSGKVIWRVRLFHNRPLIYWDDSKLVYIGGLALVSDNLIATDERWRCYSVNLTTRRSKKQKCDPVR
jgi:hypothetical protein